MAFSARFEVVILAILLGSLAVALLQAGASGQDAPSPEGPVETEGAEVFAAKRLIVAYEPGASEAAESEAVQRVAGEVQRDIESAGAEVVGLPAAEEASPGEERKEALRRAKEALEEDPAVAEVEYDYVRRSSYVPSDPSFSGQWGLRKATFPRSWGSGGGNDGEGVAIAVVDSGIDADHPDLRGKVIAQRDFVDDDGVAGDDGGHGTHVAGIAAARTGNGAGIAGGCPDCDLIVARVTRGGVGYDSDVAAGITWAADNGAKAINLSLNGPAPSGTLKRAMDYAWGKGAVVVAASGNAGNDAVQYPAAYSTAIAVAASDGNDRRASFSSYGGWVDVSAPGVDVLSAVPGGGYGYKSGTSMATPHVAALAGLLISRGLTNEEAKTRILSAAADTGPAGRDPYHGSGRINAVRAVFPDFAPTPPSPALPLQEDEAREDRANDANVDSNGEGRRRLAADDVQPPPPEPEPAPEPPPPSNEEAMVVKSASTRAPQAPPPTPSPQPPARETEQDPDPPESRRITFTEFPDPPADPAPDAPQQTEQTDDASAAPPTTAASSWDTTFDRALVGGPGLLLLALLMAARRLYGRRQEQQPEPRRLAELPPRGFAGRQAPQEVHQTTPRPNRRGR